eukprot:TRINITY_DN32726_c0_g1_i1.p1 TRINITY_DN32726_c0_g1~~TRINITY_DN32726_c0_g1_i1.p1  ORF type:complete len:442 (+),score=65.26 TRINITY_DN32726_c0_g1_i1:85-1410(+)
MLAGMLSSTGHRRRSRDAFEDRSSSPAAEAAPGQPPCKRQRHALREASGSCAETAQRLEANADADACGRLEQLRARFHAWRAEGQGLLNSLRCKRLRVEPDAASVGASAASPSSGSRRRPILPDIGDGPYFYICQFFGARTLCEIDRSCRLLLSLNRGTSWKALGIKEFFGIELKGDAPQLEGRFDIVGKVDADLSRTSRPEVDWKERYRLFAQNLLGFMSPFDNGGNLIDFVTRIDSVAYVRCWLDADALSVHRERGVYIEFEVADNPDNLSIALVDFDVGGCSSITFSPDTGAVIRERKVREKPRKVEGAYIQPLDAIRGSRFHGHLGIHVRGGQLGFSRRCSSQPLSQGGVMGPWEFTGFISDLTWADGHRLTPCLAFRDPGAYSVKLRYLRAESDSMPVEVGRQHKSKATTVPVWTGLDWEEQPPALQEQHGDGVWI